MQGTVVALKNSVAKSQAFLLNIAEEKRVLSWLTCDPSLEFKLNVFLALFVFLFMSPVAVSINSAC